MTVTAELLALAELIAAWVVVGVRYGALPAMVRSPFNGGGDAGGLGEKNQLWLLVILAMFLYLLLSGVAKIIHSLEWTGVPAASAPAMRRRVTGVLLAAKVIVMAMFLWLAISVAFAVPEGWRQPMRIGLPAALGVLIIVAAVKLRRREPATSALRME
jgi:hypothetical protein